MKDDRAWFAPKRFGYGAGLPIAWQGWALLCGFVVLVAAIMPLAPHHPWRFAGLVLALLAAFLPICAAKTRGGWRWRSGGD